MTSEALLDDLERIQKEKCETAIREIKSAANGCPKRLYDTLSSFSNQDCGGTIYFGIDETDNYAETGVYDPQDIQKKINEQCLQMEPIVRPVLTVAEKDGKMFVAAEVPGMEMLIRPCFYKGKGRLGGAYVRIGDSDEQMTEYEVYSFEAYKKHYRADYQVLEDVSRADADEDAMTEFIIRAKREKPHFAKFSYDKIMLMLGMIKGENLTVAGNMYFHVYPQAVFPQLCITAVNVPGVKLGEVGDEGQRFIDNERFDGTIPDMLKGAMNFVERNMQRMTTIDPDTGIRTDKYDYPVDAVREAVVNALVHRDYSEYTRGMPIRIMMFKDRMEIQNPGGIYGNIPIDKLEYMPVEARNPAIVEAMEILGLSENRYTGIPTIKYKCKKAGLPDPEFIDRKGFFKVVFHKRRSTVDYLTAHKVSVMNVKEAGVIYNQTEKKLMEFCTTPRNRQEITEFLGIKSQTYAIREYVTPLVERGLIQLDRPEAPRSQKQLYYCKIL